MTPPPDSAGAASDVPPFRRILLVQACAITATIVAGITAGLIAASWAWAIASAVVIYAASQAAVMVWAAWWMISRRPRRLESDDGDLEFEDPPE
jgi:hypothetical protein